MTRRARGTWCFTACGSTRRCRSPPPPQPHPGTKWTRRVPHPVLIGHAASLTPYYTVQVAAGGDALSPFLWDVDGRARVAWPEGVLRVDIDLQAWPCPRRRLSPAPPPPCSLRRRGSAESGKRKSARKGRASNDSCMQRYRCGAHAGAGRAGRQEVRGSMTDAQYGCHPPPPPPSY